MPLKYLIIYSRIIDYLIWHFNDRLLLFKYNDLKVFNKALCLRFSINDGTFSLHNGIFNLFNGILDDLTQEVISLLRTRNANT